MKNAKVVAPDLVFCVGEEVWDLVYGPGTIINVRQNEIAVEFGHSGITHWYSKDGCKIEGNVRRSLYPRTCVAVFVDLMRDFEKKEENEL